MTTADSVHDLLLLTLQPSPKKGPRLNMLATCKTVCLSVASLKIEESFKPTRRKRFFIVDEHPWWRSNLPR